VISPYEQVKLSEPRGFADQTVRQVLHMAGGGERLRVRLTNRYGRTPLTIAAATVATEHGSAALTFDGTRRLTIPPGEEAVGDPIDLPVAPGADLFLGLNFPAETGLATYSHKPIETAHIVGGNHVTSAALPEAEEIMALPRSGTSPYVGKRLRSLLDAAGFVRCEFGACDPPRICRRSGGSRGLHRLTHRAAKP
jgi:hypothetical protein